MEGRVVLHSDLNNCYASIECMLHLFEMPKSYEQNPMEDTLLWDEQVAALYAAIAQLTPIQQRRIHMLMENMTIREIARQEGCHMNAALKSVNGALKKLHDLLKDWA